MKTDIRENSVSESDVNLLASIVETAAQRLSKISNLRGEESLQAIIQHL